VSHSQGTKAIEYMLEKHMKAHQISPISKKHQQVCFDRLKQEAKDKDEYNRRLQEGRANTMAKIVALFNDGKSPAEIGEIHNITPSTVNQYLRDAGIKQKKSKNDRIPKNKSSSNRGRPPKPVDET
jgi:intein-encoded DNA endonuclease-like protein